MGPCQNVLSIGDHRLEYDDESIECRVFRSSRSDGERFTLKVATRLPIFMNMKTWLRHDFSREDVEVTLNLFPTKCVWALAMLMGIVVSNSSIRISFARPESLVHSAKVIVIKKIMATLAREHFFRVNMPSVLHQGVVPFHPIASPVWSEMAGIIGNRVVRHRYTLDYFSPNNFDKIFRWRDILLIPLTQDDRLIFCTRVVQSTGDEQVQHPDVTCMHNRRRSAEVCHNQRQFFTVDESCFFYADPGGSLTGVPGANRISKAQKRVGTKHRKLGSINILL